MKETVLPQSSVTETCVVIIWRQHSKSILHSKRVVSNEQHFKYVFHGTWGERWDFGIASLNFQEGQVRRRSLEGGVAEQQLVDDDSKCPDVGGGSLSGIDLLPHDG